MKPKGNVTLKNRVPYAVDSIYENDETCDSHVRTAQLITHLYTIRKTSSKAVAY